MRNATQIQSLAQAKAVFDAKAKNSRTYVECDKAVRIGSNLSVRLITATGGYAIRYHQTDIVTYEGEHVRVSTGGWNSVTTVKHLNHFTPGHLRFNGVDILSRRADARPRTLVTNADDGEVEEVTPYGLGFRA